MTKSSNYDHDTDFGLSTAFGIWLRKQPELDSRIEGIDINDIDYAVFHYKKGTLLLIEEKRFGSTVSEAQRDSLNLIHQMLKFAAESGHQFRTFRGTRTIQYLGFHTVTFSHSGPDDSEWITWDGKIIAKEDLSDMIKGGTP